MSAARLLRFRTEPRRRLIVRGHLRDARRWIDLGLAGRVTLDAAVAAAYLAVIAANREAIRGQLDPDRAS